MAAFKITHLPHNIESKNTFDFRATSMASNPTTVVSTKKSSVENKLLKNWMKNKESKILNRMDVQDKYASFSFLSKLNSIYKDRGLNLHENYKNRTTQENSESETKMHNDIENCETPIRIRYHETPKEYMDPKIRDVIESNKYHQNRKKYAQEEYENKNGRKKRVSFEDDGEEEMEKEDVVKVKSCRKERLDCSSQCDFDMVRFIDDTAEDYAEISNVNYIEKLKEKSINAFTTDNMTLKSSKTPSNENVHSLDHNHFSSFQNSFNFPFQKTYGSKNHFKWNSNHFTEYKGGNDLQGIIGTIPDVDGKVVGGKNTVLDKVFVYSQCGTLRGDRPCVTVVTNAGQIPRLSSKQFQPINPGKEEIKTVVYTNSNNNKTTANVHTNSTISSTNRSMFAIRSTENKEDKKMKKKGKKKANHVNVKNSAKTNTIEKNTNDINQLIDSYNNNDLNRDYLNNQINSRKHLSDTNDRVNNRKGISDINGEIKIEKEDITYIVEDSSVHKANYNPSSSKVNIDNNNNNSINVDNIINDNADNGINDEDKKKDKNTGALIITNNKSKQTDHSHLVVAESGYEIDLNEGKRKLYVDNRYARKSLRLKQDICHGEMTDIHRKEYLQHLGDKLKINPNNSHRNNHQSSKNQNKPDYKKHIANCANEVSLSMKDITVPDNTITNRTKSEVRESVSTSRTQDVEGSTMSSDMNDQTREAISINELKSIPSKDALTKAVTFDKHFTESNGSLEKKENPKDSPDLDRNLMNDLSFDKPKLTSDSSTMKRIQSVSFADEAEEIIDEPSYFVPIEEEEDFQKFYEREKLNTSDLSITIGQELVERVSETSNNHDDFSLSQTKDDNLHDVNNEHGSKAHDEKLNILKTEDKEEGAISTADSKEENVMLETKLLEEEKDISIKTNETDEHDIDVTGSFVELDAIEETETNGKNEIATNVIVPEGISSDTISLKDIDNISVKSTEIIDNSILSNDQTCVYSTLCTTSVSDSFIPYRNVKTEITSDFRSEGFSSSTTDFLSHISNERKVDSSTDNESQPQADDDIEIEVESLLKEENYAILEEKKIKNEILSSNGIRNSTGTKCSLENYKINIGSIKTTSIVSNEKLETDETEKVEIATHVETKILTNTIATPETTSVVSLDKNNLSFWRFNDSPNLNESVVITQKNKNGPIKPPESESIGEPSSDDVSYSSAMKIDGIKEGRNYSTFSQEIVIPTNTEPKVTFILQGHGKPSEKIVPEKDTDQLSYVSLNSANMSRESPLFSPMTRRVQLKEKTNLDKLNFSKISAKIRRSRYGSNSNSISNISNESVDGSSLYATRVDTYVLMSDGLSHLSSGSYATHPPNTSTAEDPEDDQKTTVTLSKKWSGGLVATHDSTNHIYNYHVDVYPEQTSETGKKLHKIIFRNTAPIQEIKSANADKMEEERVDECSKKEPIVDQSGMVNDQPCSSKDGYELSKRLESPMHSPCPGSSEFSRDLQNCDLSSMGQDIYGMYYSTPKASQKSLSIASSNSIEGAIIHSTYNLNESCLLGGSPPPNDIVWNMDQRLYPSNPENMCTSGQQKHSLTPESRRDPRRIPEGTFQGSMRRITQVLNSDNLSPLSHLISIIWKDEGRKVRMEFLRYILQINDVINDLLENIPKNIFPFKIKPLSIDRDFELTNKNSISLYLLLEDFDQNNIQIDFQTDELLLSNVNLSEDRLEEMKFCSRKLQSTGKWNLSPKLLIEYFSQSIDNYNKCIYQKKLSNVKKMSSLHSFVDFEHVTKTCIKLNIHFPRKKIMFEVTLLLAIDIKDLSCEKHYSNSLCSPLQTTLECSGFHLLAQPLLDKWEVSFLKARKFLFSTFDKEQIATSILLALQYVNEEVLGKEGCDKLLPVHFYMLIFWTQSSTYKTERAWNEKNIAYHFLHVINALKQCLVDRQCIDFFWPKINYFDRIPETCLRKISINLNEFIADLEIYVRSGGKQMKQMTT